MREKEGRRHVLVIALHSLNTDWLRVRSALFDGFCSSLVDCEGKRYPLDVSLPGLAIVHYTLTLSP